MEIPAPSTKVFGPGLSVWDARSAGALVGPRAQAFRGALDKIAELSGQAQNLSRPVTTTEDLLRSDHKVYVLCTQDGARMLGYLKVGWKHLFLCKDDMSALLDGDALCLLDFYVYESAQRSGVGRLLFNTLLKEEQVSPAAIAYDRPSPKLRPFLAKHFGLQGGIDQANHFMVFEDFFDEAQGFQVRARR